MKRHFSASSAQCVWQEACGSAWVASPWTVTHARPSRIRPARAMARLGRSAVSGDSYICQPTLIDAILHLGIYSHTGEPSLRTVVPVAVEGFKVLDDTPTLWATMVGGGAPGDYTCSFAAGLDAPDDGARSPLTISNMVSRPISIDQAPRRYTTGTSAFVVERQIDSPATNGSSLAAVSIKLPDLACARPGPMAFTAHLLEIYQSASNTHIEHTWMQPWEAALGGGLDWQRASATVLLGAAAMRGVARSRNAELSRPSSTAEEQSTLLRLASHIPPNYTRGRQVLIVATEHHFEDEVAAKGVKAHPRICLDTPDIRRQTPPSYSAGKSATIMGGNGALGGLVALHLSAHGPTGRAAEIILLGRSKTRAASTHSGIGMTTSIMCDVASSADTSFFLESACRAPHHNLLHAGALLLCVLQFNSFHAFQIQSELCISRIAGGVLRDGLVPRMRLGMVRQALAPKVAGGGLAARATAAMPLQGFVLFSSVAAVLGNPGQTNYSAANSVLDATAAQMVQQVRLLRVCGLMLLSDASHANTGCCSVGIDLPTTQGRASTSIQWGPWLAQGMVTASVEKALMRQGVGLLSPTLGLEMLWHVMSRPSSQSASTTFSHRATAALGLCNALDWPSMMRPWDDLCPKLDWTALAVVAQPRNPLFTDGQVQEFLESIVQNATGSKIQSGSTFMEMGLDSLAMIKLQTATCAHFGVDLPPTVAFEYPTVGALGAVVQKCLRSAVAPFPNLAPPASWIVGGVSSVPVTSVPKFMEPDASVGISELLKEILGSVPPVHQPFMEVRLVGHTLYKDTNGSVLKN